MGNVGGNLGNVGGGSAYLASEVPSGYLHKTNNTAEQTVLSVNTPIKVTATTSLDSSETNDWTHSNNRLTYSGSRTHKADITFNLTGYPGAGGAAFQLQIYKNGSVLNGAVYAELYCASSAETKQGELTMPDEVSNGDYYEVWVEEVVTGADLYTEVLTLKTEFTGWV
jgi:hypothetical protein